MAGKLKRAFGGALAGGFGAVSDLMQYMMLQEAIGKRQQENALLTQQFQQQQDAQKQFTERGTSLQDRVLEGALTPEQAQVAYGLATGGPPYGMEGLPQVPPMHLLQGLAPTPEHRAAGLVENIDPGTSESAINQLLLGRGLGLEDPSAARLRAIPEEMRTAARLEQEAVEPAEFLEQVGPGGTPFTSAVRPGEAARQGLSFRTGMTAGEEAGRAGQVAGATAGATARAQLSPDIIVAEATREARLTEARVAAEQAALSPQLSAAADQVLANPDLLDQYSADQRNAVLMHMAQRGDQFTPKAQQARMNLLSKAQGLITQLKAHPGLGPMVGVGPLEAGERLLHRSAARDAQTLFDMLMTNVGLPNLEFFKGTGPVSDREFQAAMSAASAINPQMSEAGFKTLLQDLETWVNVELQNQMRMTGGVPIGPPTTPSTAPVASPTAPSPGLQVPGVRPGITLVR